MSHDVTLAGAHSLVGTAVNDARTGAVPPDAFLARTPYTTTITVEVAAGARLATLQADWQDLAARADTANIFMHPAIMQIVGKSYPERPCRVLLAWKDAGTGVPRIAGIWAFAIDRAPQSLIPMSVLTAPPMPNAYLSTPVIDRECLDSVLDAMLTHIAEDASLPKIVALDAMGAETATMQSLLHVLKARRSASCIFNQSLRPKLASDLDGKVYLERALSSSSRKKLRQHRRRLVERGTLHFSILTDADALKRAFEDFLALEASGWKGRYGTALLSRTADAQFARALITALAAQGEAAIHMLTLDGRPVSMQIVLRAGPAAFTWKTANDEALHDVSPGMLLLEDYTAALLADDGVAYVNSCAFDDNGYMGAWTERAAIAQMWFETRRGGSSAFTVLSRLQASYLSLRTRAKAIYHNNRQHKVC